MVGSYYFQQLQFNIYIRSTVYKLLLYRFF